jgi:hypothetical protein
MLVSMLFPNAPKMRYKTNKAMCYAITPWSRRILISSKPIPKRPSRTSFVCCPRVGGGVLILGFEKEYFTGVFTNFIGPQAG